MFIMTMSSSHVIFPEHSWKHIYLLTKIIFLMLILLDISWASSCGDGVLPPIENPKDGACGDMDIRNSVKNFRMLENCTVIEGSLHISLIDKVPQKEYDKYSFPLLREITGHLMMFRVFGLRTLRGLFPNLAVIRGQTKFFKEYALVAYEMHDLEELGLVGLTNINGSVRLTKNHKLCHINSIDWGKLTSEVDSTKHLFADNREDQLCPDFCNESCPSTTYPIYQGTNRRRCWTSKAEDCQRNLECHCPRGIACAPNGSCCNEQCVGGCSGPTASDCYVCSKVIYQNICQPHCPHSTFMLSNRRCVSDKECLSLRSRSTRVNRSDSSDNFPKLLVGNGITPNQCVFKCPSGYMVDENKTLDTPMCIPCPGFCPKVCNTTKVSSIQDSEKLFGCSKIDGNLEIQITGGDIDLQLAKNLGDIREITGYLKIWKSYALYTLHFFRDLKTIGGEKLVHRRYSLFIADNANLEEIFPQQQIENFVIKKGNISFHGNRRLCLSKILNFVSHVNRTSGLDEKRIDVSNTSNGNLVPCVSVPLTLEVVEKNRAISLVWDKYAHTLGDTRQLRHYVISYKEVTQPVKDIFQGRDACSDNVWKIKHIEPTQDATKELEMKEEYEMLNLKSFTKYAVYVQAITLSTAPYSAMSNIIYFQTSPSEPTQPTNLKVQSSDPQELTVTWGPPESPNGNVTHYKIYYQQQSPSTNVFEERDFCKDPSVNSKDLIMENERIKTEEEKNSVVTSGCCVCTLSAEEALKRQRMHKIVIELEDYMLKKTFTKIQGEECKVNNNITVSDNGRRRRHTDISSNGLDFNNPIIFRYKPTEANQSKNVTSLGREDENTTNLSTSEPYISSVKHEVIVYDLNVTLSNLEPYHSYSIEVYACQETDPVTGHKACGPYVTAVGQTAANQTADNLNSSLVETLTDKNGHVLIRWEPPSQPNGLILKYYLKYRNLDPEKNSNPVTVCVSTKQFKDNNHGYLLQGLLPGEYSVQISAHSLAGNGSYTEEKKFQVLSWHEESDRLMKIGVGTGMVLLLIFVIGMVIYCYYKQRFVNPVVLVSENPHYIPTDQLYSPDEWEVPRDTIRLIKELGQGSFGTVFEGLMEDPKTKVATPVAVKTVNDKADFYERFKILKEATTMKGVFECHHVVKLLGVVSKGQPALVIMELMALGDLRNYLRKCRPDEENYPDFYPPTNDQIYRMAGEIADGMAYLSDKKIVHRDLAARNCLVSEDGTVKIADFGMARDVYTTEYYRRDQKALLPVRWMAPESLKDGIFTTMSDIWSYGIVLWEILTLAEQPYQGLGNEEVLRFVSEGRVMNPPHGCPTDLYNMMHSCWAYNPRHRPTFKSLLQHLVPYLSDQFRKVSYYFKEVLKNEANDERIENTQKENCGEMELHNNLNEQIETDQELFEEDSLMVGESLHNGGDGDRIEEDNPYTSQAAGNLSMVNSKNNQKELSPSILHQNNIQEPFLYFPSVSSGRMKESEDCYCDNDDIECDNDFTKVHDKKYNHPSKDAKSSSERLKLLSDSPFSSLKVKLSPFSTKPEVSGQIDEYTTMTSPTVAAPNLSDNKIMFSSSPALSSHLAMPSATISNPLPYSRSHLVPSVAPSASPILQVDMERIGGSRDSSVRQTSVDVPGHDSDSNTQKGLLRNNNLVNKSGTSDGDRKLSDSSSNYNSNSNSIQSSSEGSKDSTCSSGSRNGFNPGTSNGHGPYSHQHTALC